MLNNFLTTYTQDYVQKKPKLIRIPKISEKNCTETTRHFEYLVLDKDPALKPPEELVDEFAENNFKQKQPALDCKYFSVPLNKNEVRKAYELRKKTIYQSDYKASLLKQPDELKFHIDEGTDLPATTYLSAYRNPRTINKMAAIKRPPIINPVSLGAEKKLHRMLNVRTGESEYTGVFGELGQQIIRDHIFGEIHHPKCD